MARSDPRRRPILPLPLPPNKSVPKPKNLPKKPTVTRSPTALAPNQPEKSRESPPSQPLTSFKPSPTLIRFPPSLNRGARVCSFLFGAQVTSDSLEWEMTSLANFISRRGTNGWSRGWVRVDLAQPRGLDWNLLPLVDCTRYSLTRRAWYVILFVRSIAISLFIRQVWSCGTNDDAALGRITTDVPDPDMPGGFLDSDTLTSTPYPIQALIDENFRAVRIAAGDSISAAISTTGDLRAWGHFRVRCFFISFTHGHSNKL